MSNWERHRAARVVAARSADAAEAAALLDMLGLTAAEGVAPAPEPVEPPTPEPVDVTAGRMVGLAMVAAIRRADA
ncbi:hypothetical protein [Actinokineospora fastidiosa]|uniref:Uncharacterized protein n=1 Tax=Actinokineospora fastidiosa TaxID=1816 RepID=A0A918GCN3_9PSEU|nr:hypothetical protein [Actinokineospora fastidiosa]GGS28505.1 hypothetical protein GCM10010171_22000 [Actinokineospora fastidiosa]